MMLIAARSWRRRLLIVVAGGLLPVGLPDLPDGLLRPAGARHRAGQGRRRRQVVAGLDLPGQLRRALRCCGCRLVLLVAARACCCWPPAAGRRVLRAAPAPDYGRLARAVQSPPAVVVFIVFSGLLQALYWIRQGGDFMHGRVLLAPLFCLLAPVAVDPVVLPDGTGLLAGDRLLAGRRRRRALAGDRGLVAVGGELAGDGRRRHPRHLLRHRRRAPLLCPGHRSRAPADRRRLPGLPADGAPS